MSISWWQLTITAPVNQMDDIAASVIRSTGNGVAEPQPGVVCTTVDSEEFAQRLRIELTDDFPDARISVEQTEWVDWSTRWRDGILTRTFGRLVVTPSWLPVLPAFPQVVVSIDPESAFGSGEHGSTRGALALLERHLGESDRVLDLGSGSGILAIAAAKLGARSAIGIEVDEESMPIAVENARKNGVERIVGFLHGDAAELAPLAGPAELVCSNILRSVNTLLMPGILGALVPGGVAVFAGMEEAEEELFLPVLEAHRFKAIDTVRDAGWWSVVARVM